MKVPERYNHQRRATQLDWIAMVIATLLYVTMLIYNLSIVLSTASFLAFLYAINIAGETKEYAKYKKLLRKQKREEPYFYMKRTTAYLLAGIVIGLFLSALMWGLS